MTRLSSLRPVDTAVADPGVQVNTKCIKENWESVGLTALDEAFSKPFSELCELPKALGRRRIVGLIEDLDCCSSEKVVSVLRTIIRE